MKFKYLFTTVCASAALSAAAHTVLLSEDFNGDYTVNFPVTIDADHQEPAHNIQSLFINGNGVMCPWWRLKDSSTSSDSYIASHSFYSKPSKSNDWLCSRAIQIPGEAFELSFDAQSVGYRKPARQSSLWIFVTETPVTSESNLPTEPTWVIENLTFGEDDYAAVGDFARFTYSLDQWAGKTIYINFANLNEDADVVAIDNLIVQRLDPAEINVTALPLAVAGNYELETNIKGTEGEGLRNWVLKAVFSNGEEFTLSGESLAKGDSKDIAIPFSIKADEKLLYTITLSSDNAEPIISEGMVQGMAFMPVHRVLMEEATGLWCGNCPMGQFAIESMMHDPEMKDKVVPVSVHVPSSVHANYLVIEDYATPLGMTVAPQFRLDREFVAMNFSRSHDLKYDPSDPESAVGTVRERASRITTMNVSVDADFIVQNGDTTAIRAKATVVPSYTMDPKDKYTVGFVLTENNVWLKKHYSWAQENYLSGYTEADGNVGGWTELEGKVYNVRLQDVARAIAGYRGIDNSLPSAMEMNREYTFEYEIKIPDTLIKSGEKINSPAIVPANCGIVAFVIDRSTETVVNAAYHPMTELTEKRFTTADLVKANSGVEEIEFADDTEAVPVYYTIDGIQVSNPEKGHLYIVRKGSKASKIIF